MKINGFEYTADEVFEALRKRGYTLLRHKTYIERHIHGSTFEKDWYETRCAVKGADLPSDENQWDIVAKMEFEKEIVKPPLV